LRSGQTGSSETDSSQRCHFRISSSFLRLLRLKNNFKLLRSQKWSSFCEMNLGAR
jgi:hypothetical protein